MPPELDHTSILIAVIGAVVTIVSALIAATSAHRARKANRSEEVEELLVKARKDNALLWNWNRGLVDQIYSGKPPPPNPPPAGLFD